MSDARPISIEKTFETNSLDDDLQGKTFILGKRMFDILVSLSLLPVFAVTACALLLLNPVWNKGTLFYIQPRMGRGCRAFGAIKFRTMTEAPNRRSAACPLEIDRITPLGCLLRRTRIDELPQILNVLIGDMALIGPRPDYFNHARRYLKVIPGYRERHVVRPGISGLAQVSVGYVEGYEGTRKKVQADLHYIGNRSWRMEAWIFWQTLKVVVLRQGT